MFNLSFGEILILSVIGLLVLGPKQLPQIARVLGRTYNEFRKAFREVGDVVGSEFKGDILKSSVKNTIAGALLADKVQDKNSAPVEVFPKEVLEVTAMEKKIIEKKSIEEVMRELGK